MDGASLPIVRPLAMFWMLFPFSISTEPLGSPGFIMGVSSSMEGFEGHGG